MALLAPKPQPFPPMPAARPPTGCRTPSPLRRRTACGSLRGDGGTLAELVAEFKESRDYSGLAFYRSQPTIADAIRAATCTLGPEDKIEDHQRRNGRATLKRAATALLKRIKQIEKCQSFAELLACVEEATEGIERFGELAAYDTSFRIGLKLKLTPKAVYLHTGTRDGCRALGLKGNRKYVEISELPKELRLLKPHEAEDFLCIYKDEFVASKDAKGMVLTTTRQRKV
jgi:hypothetical protein